VAKTAEATNRTIASTVRRFIHVSFVDALGLSQKLRATGYSELRSACKGSSTSVGAAGA
jgi:hypothetical protein